MIVLDTDHLTVLFFEKHSQRESLSNRLLASDDREIATSVISLEEQMRGWLSAIKKQPYAADQVPLYPRLMQLVEFYSQWDVLPFDSRSADTYLGLRKQKVRVGTADLKIASIALVNNALLLTANLVDFQKIPGLRVEDWLYG